MSSSSSPNLISWHFSQAAPSYTRSQLKKIAGAAAFFNFIGLLKNLLAPYRRLTISKQSGNKIDQFFNQLSFNLISRAVGAVIRVSIIIGGSILFLIICTYYLLTIPIYLIIPLFSFSDYQKQQNETVRQSDIDFPEKFTAKLLKNNLYKQLSIFFNNNFKLVFDKVDLKTVDIKPGTTVKDALAILLKNDPKLQIFLERQKIKPKDFQTLIETITTLQKPKAGSKIIPLGETLAYGYTNTLDRYSIELTRQNQPIAHINPTLVSQIERILVRPQDNNVLLVGEPGVGRHTTLNMIAAAIQNRQAPALAGKRLMLLDTVSLAANGTNLTQIKSILGYILEEGIRAGNIILAVDQIDKIVSSSPGRVDLSQSLIEHLKSQLPLIGITTTDDYSEFVRTNTPLIKLFEKIDVPEATDEETLAILIEKSLEEYNKHKIQIYLSSLTEIIAQSNKLLSERKQPEKSIIFTNDIIGDAKNQKVVLINPDYVEKVLSTLTPIPVGKISSVEKDTLKNLETLLHQRIIGQDEAIIEIAKAMRRARAELETAKRPIGSFLFLGPTGVGKTETAKVLASTYFGNAANMVRLDMSEFQDNDALKKLAGDAQNKTPGILTSQIRQHPFSLLLLDEFEKANTNVLNLFLQVFDEGFMTDALGKKVNFDNNIIIATSNAGAEFIREQTEAGKTITSEQLTDYILQKGLLSPELINRFDAVVVYHPLTQIEVVKVTTLILQDLSAKLKETKNITLEITPELAAGVAQAGFDPQFGARPIRRLIQNKIEDEIAKMIIDDTVKNGEIIKAEALLKSLK